MEYGLAFAYIRNDPDWLKKLAIAAAISLIPIIGPVILLGYGLGVTRHVIQAGAEAEGALPAWGDWGRLIRDGVMGVIIQAGYALPLLLLVICLGLPAALFPTALQEQPAEVASTVTIVLSLCAACPILLAGLVTAMTIPAALGRFAVDGDLAGAFQVGQVFQSVRAKFGVYLITLILTGLATSLLPLLGALACGVGALAGFAYATLAAAHLYGQAYRLNPGQA